MFRCSAALAALLALATLTPHALAQPAPVAPAPRADPLDSRAAVPPAAPPGALRRYRAATTPEPGGWREANDTVTRIGGWKTYLREAQQPDPAASAPAGAASAPAAKPAKAPHHGHH